MNTGLRVGLTACVAIAAAWVGAQVYLARIESPAARRVPVLAVEASAPPSTDQPAPTQAQAQAPIAIPDKLPDFTLADLNGRRTPISRWRGKSLMINFWATWCAPCQREIPLLQALYTEKSADNIEIIGIAVDYADKVRAFRNQFKITYPLLVGEQDALDLVAALGVEAPAFPLTVFTDRRGQIVALYMGELKRPQVEMILSQVQEVNRDHISLAAARTRIAEQLKSLRELT